MGLGEVRAVQPRFPAWPSDPLGGHHGEDAWVLLATTSGW